MVLKREGETMRHEADTVRQMEQWCFVISKHHTQSYCRVKQCVSIYSLSFLLNVSGRWVCTLYIPVTVSHRAEAGSNSSTGKCDSN